MQDEINLLQAENRSNIATIDHLNSKITILTGEVKLLHNDQKTLEDEKEEFKNQLNSEKVENENLRNRILQLENEKTKIQSELYQIQRETTEKVLGLTYENQNLQRSLETCQRKNNCLGPIVGNNGLSLLKNQSEIQFCQDNGSYDEQEKSILIFDYRAINGSNEIYNPSLIFDDDVIIVPS